MTTERTLEQKRKAIQAFATATLKGARWAMQNPQAAAAISQKVLPDVSKEEIMAGLNHFADIQYYNVDGLLSKAAWDFTVDELVKGNELRRSSSTAITWCRPSPMRQPRSSVPTSGSNRSTRNALVRDDRVADFT